MSNPALQQERMTFHDAARLDPDEHSGELDEGRWVPVTKNPWRHGPGFSCKVAELFEV
ncbi:MAG TPA: hypothetical protein VE093_25950 [Polyangiaceae bacterium]|nr:hypothetical protein [Polyangiaceae bacterium]